MSLGDRHTFGTIFAKSKINKETVQLSSIDSIENAESFLISDTYSSVYSRQWLEIQVNGQTLYLGLNFAFTNCSPGQLYKFYNQMDYIDGNDYRTVLLTEEEWKSIPIDYISQIAWNDYPDVYVRTKTISDNKVVWLRYEDGQWERRLWGYQEDIGTLYINGFIPILYKSREAWKKEETQIKAFDLEPQHRPFGVRYEVRDKDNQVLTVTEKLNGKVIKTINNFDKNKYGIVEIKKSIFDTLEMTTLNTIEIIASDGIQYDTQLITFRKINNSPNIVLSGSSDLGTMENKPVIKYRIEDPDGDKATVIEKINGAQVRTYTSTTNAEQTFAISDSFWESCKLGKNIAEIHAVDPYGAKFKKEISFEKAASNITHTVFYAIENDIRNERIFELEDGTKELRGYTYAYNTKNKSMNFSLADLREGAEIKVWIVTHNPYASSTYKISNTLTFKKAFYGKPIIGIPTEGNILTQSHSEYGYITVTYEHEDVEKVNGVLQSKDPTRKLSDYEGTIEIKCFVDGKYKCIYPLDDDTIQVGETKEYRIDFDQISPGSRSHTITYLVNICDKYTGKLSTIKDHTKATAGDFISGFHYYNDEPVNPTVSHAYKDTFAGDTLEYGFKYLNLYWNNLVDKDGDHSIYYLYLKTPKTFNENVYTISVPSRTGPNTIEYTREYRIVEKRDSKGNVIGSTAYYYNAGKYIKIQENNFLGFHLDYIKDHLGREWPEKESFDFALVARDERPWDNSYYGLFNSVDENFDYCRKSHTYPNEVELTIIPNLVDGLGDGEKGRISVLYTHPEIKDREGIVDIYAYQDGQLITKVYSGEFYPDKEQTITIDFSMYEHNIKNEKEKVLKRSKDVTYYAVATDTLGFNSLEKFKQMSLEYIPLLMPDEDGKYGYYIININGVSFDFNNDTFEYEGPVQVGKHYFNEEPPATTPEEYDPTYVGYEIVEIKWPHVVDPDGDEVKYEVYVSSSAGGFNIEEKEFFNDNQPDGQDYVESENNERAIVSTLLKYHKVIEVPASVAAEYSKKFKVSVKEYIEDSDINIWIVSKDPYVNSYYRAGDILRVAKGHEAKEIRIGYPRNDSVVYAKTPRILIYLAKDNLEQTVFVQWLDEIYNNRDNPELFSNEPNTTNIIVFKPPVVYTGVSGNKVTYSVWVHNRCSYSPKTYVTYTYRDFFDSLDTEEHGRKLIPIKSSHINLFRQAINVVRDAYGLDQFKYSREVRKDMIFENTDFNETKKAIMEINDKLNNADPGDGLDHINNLIVDIKDLDLVEYEGIIGATSYEEFLEWARLLYILENL